MSHVFEAAQEKVLTRLRTTAIPSVFEVAVPAGYKLPVERGVHLPYICVAFGGMSPVRSSNQGITSSKDDLKWTTVSVEVVGESPKTVRKVTAIVRDVLEGYIVDETWSELSETLAGDYTVYTPDYDLWPVRYATGIFFNGMANA